MMFFHLVNKILGVVSVAFLQKDQSFNAEKLKNI